MIQKMSGQSVQKSKNVINYDNNKVGIREVVGYDKHKEVKGGEEGMKQKKVRNAVVVFGILVCLLVLCVLFSLYVKKQDILLYMDGEPVYQEEFLIYLEKVKQPVRDRLMKQQEAPFDWNKTVDGKPGYQHLADAAKEYAAPIKAIQHEAKKLNLIKTTDFTDIEKQRQQVNEERRKTKEEGGVLYGVVEYEKTEYLDYINSNLMLRYQDALKDKGVLTVSDAECSAVYDKEPGRFGNEPYENVADGVKNVVLNEKYQSHIQQLTSEVEIQIPDEGALIKVVREACGMAE